MSNVIAFILLFLLTIGCRNKESNTNLESAIYEMLLSDDTAIDDFSIVNISGDTISLKTLVNEHSIVIIGLYNVDCLSCAERELELLKSTIKQDKNEDIVILGNFPSLRKMRVFQENVPLIIYSDKNSMLLDNIDYDVFIFRLSTDLKAYSIIDLMKYPNLSKVYYEAAIRNNN